MKKALGIVAVVLIVCGGILYFIAGVVQEQTKPNDISYGAIINGEYSQFGSGQIGGNSQAQEDMETMKTTSVILMVGGVVMAIVALAMPREEW